MSKGRWALNDFLSDTDSHITVEGAFDKRDIEYLMARGHKVTQIQEIFDKAYGPVSAIYQDKDNVWSGAEDIRVGTEAVEIL